MIVLLTYGAGLAPSPIPVVLGDLREGRQAGELRVDGGARPDHPTPMTHLDRRRADRLDSVASRVSRLSAGAPGHRRPREHHRGGGAVSEHPERVAAQLVLAGLRGSRAFR